MSRSIHSNNIVISLGISAIDVLCCALVCSLVLFLMLSTSGTASQASLEMGKNKDVIVQLQVEKTPGIEEDTRPVLRLRLRAAEDKGKVNDFWTVDQHSPIVHTSQGELFWTSEVSEEGSDSDTSSELRSRSSILQIHKPAGEWLVELGYLETQEGLLGPAKQQVTVRVMVISASCSSETQITLKLGENLELSDALNSEQAAKVKHINGCSLSQSLRVVRAL